MAAARSICIIPARGGSKRIPRKNIRPFRGRPIMEWSIRAAQEFGEFDRIMVSTDDAEIAEAARRAGAEVPFPRSAETSGDHATTPDVLLEVLEAYESLGEIFDLGCCLYPTAPFVTPANLKSGRDLLVAGRFNAVMPVVEFSYTIWRSLHREVYGRIRLNFPANLNARSQDLPKAFHDAGQWYWFRTADFRKERVLMGENTGSLVLPATEVQDIDGEADWQIAEIKHQRMFP